jgi:hypothetical protein
MSANLFLQYEPGDTGTRPLPANSTFWVSPAVVLATPDGNYTDGQAATIDVQVSLMEPAAYEVINVQVWVCDPTTNPTPSNALYPTEMAAMTNGPKTLYANPPYVPMDPSQPISTVPVIQVTGFEPWSGMTSLPGGHCCLIANCYGTTFAGMTDGLGDLNALPTANFNQLVQTDPHVAQHNIFADATPPGSQVINFPFRAATSLREGAEQVTLEIAETPPAQLRTILPSGLRQLQGANLPSGLRQLQGAKFTGLPLEISERPVKSIGLTGLPQEGRAIELELEANESQVLTATVELDPAETPGAAHAFDIVQKDTDGRVEGGFRLVTIASG